MGYVLVDPSTQCCLLLLLLLLNGVQCFQSLFKNRTFPFSPLSQETRHTVHYLKKYYLRKSFDCILKWVYFYCSLNVLPSSLSGIIFFSMGLSIGRFLAATVYLGVINGKSLEKKLPTLFNVKGFESMSEMKT